MSDLARDLLAQKRAVYDAPALGPTELTDELSPPGLRESTPTYQPRFATGNPSRFRRAAKAFEFMKLAFEPLDRAKSAYRVGILTATGRYHPDEYSDRVNDAFDGKLRLPNSEFNNLLVGHATMAGLRQIGLPGWTQAAAAPDIAITGSKRQPVISIGNAMDFGADFLADPFAVLMMTPAGPAFEATKAGKILAAPYRISTWPLRKMFGTESPLGVVNLFREPRAVLPPSIYEPMVEAAHMTAGEIHKSAVGFADRIEQAGLGTVLKSSESRKKLGAWISHLDPTQVAKMPAGMTLSAGEQGVADIMRPMIQDELAALVRSGRVKAQDVTSMNDLRDIFPRLIGRTAVPRDVQAGWNIEDYYKTYMGLRQGQDPGRGIGIAWDNLDGMETFKSFLYASKRKQHMEPTLERFAIKRHENQGLATKAELIAARLKKGESPEVANLAPWQRRYVKDLVNEFTGSGRGRAAIQFDIMAGEFWDKAYQTPLGKGVEKMLRLTGAKENLDGLLDFSPTTKISQALTHNVYRSVLGLNLSTYLYNLGQVSNFAVSHGMPSAIKGMLKFHDPEFRAARASVDLVRDYKAVFDNATWRKTALARYDDVLFYGMEASEKLIRSFGFNVGLEDYLKRNGLKSLTEARVAGKVDKALSHAHLESLKGSFIYGTLGRAPALANPAIRPLAALTSYSIKQAEFYHDAFMKDGGAFLRFLGLHGWLIEQMNNHLGVAGERVMGWGFLPQTRSLSGVPLMESPSTRMLLDTTEWLQAIHRGDFRERQRLGKKVLSELPTGLGLNPLPAVEWGGWVGPYKDPAVGGDVQRLWQRILTKRQQIGEGYVGISNGDAIRAYLAGRTTTMQMRENLRDSEFKANQKINGELDRRASNFVKAMTDPKRDGDKFIAASRAMAEPVWIEGLRVWPEWAQYNTRMKRMMDAKRVPADRRALDDLGITEQLFWRQHLDLLQRTYTQ